MDDAIVPRFVIHDRDSKFARAFDQVFASDGTTIIKTPAQAPNANTFAERWVRTVREERLDWVLICGRRHLERVLDEYVRHYNDQRPHQGLRLRPPSSIDIESTQHRPLSRSPTAFGGGITSGGLVHEYYQAAA